MQQWEGCSKNNEIYAPNEVILSFLKRFFDAFEAKIWPGGYFPFSYINKIEPPLVSSDDFAWAKNFPGNNPQDDGILKWGFSD